LYPALPPRRGEWSTRPRSTLYEHDQPGERREPLEWPIAHDLMGYIQAADLCVTDLRADQESVRRLEAEAA